MTGEKMGALQLLYIAGLCLNGLNVYIYKGKDYARACYAPSDKGQSKKRQVSSVAVVAKTVPVKKRVRLSKEIAKS